MKNVTEFTAKKNDFCAKQLTIDDTNDNKTTILITTTHIKGSNNSCQLFVYVKMLDNWYITSCQKPLHV